MKREIHNIQTGEKTLVDLTSDEITAKNARQAEVDKTAYILNRRFAYPKMVEQFDKLWHDIDDGKLDKTGSWYQAVKAVKEDIPKP